MAGPVEVLATTDARRVRYSHDTMSAPPLPCARLSVSTPLELLDPPCLKYAVSKTLGYGIVVGSAGVKLPQLLAIYRAGGVTGLSGSSIVIEMASCACSFAYFMALGYPFSTWGENFFLFFGQAVITAFYYHFTSGLLGARSIGTFVPLAALGIVLYKRMVPDIVVPPALCALLRLPCAFLRLCTARTLFLCGGSSSRCGVFLLSGICKAQSQSLGSAVLPPSALVLGHHGMVPSCSRGGMLFHRGGRSAQHSRDAMELFCWDICMLIG